jgi:hypothetical protein
MISPRRLLALAACVPLPLVGYACSSSSSSSGATDGGYDSSLDGNQSEEGGDAPVAETGPEGGPGDASDGSADASDASDATQAADANDSGDASGDADAGDAAPEAAVEAGPPQPVVLATDAPNAWLLATDGTSVYWIDQMGADAGAGSGHVMSMPVDGGTEVTLATTTGRAPERLAIDANNVYWTDDASGLWQVSKSGGTATQLDGTHAALPVAASGGFVYYGVVPGAGVSKVPVDGGTVTPLATSGSPVDLVVVAGDVFWANVNGTIEDVPAGAGGTPFTLLGPDVDAASGEFVTSTTAQNITTDGTSLYWNRHPGAYPGAVMSLPVGGGSPQVVVNTGTDTPMSVATDGASIFYLDEGASTSLVQVPIGGSPTTLTTSDLGAAAIAGSPGPTIAVDSKSVYWLNPPQIVKIAK